MLEDLEMFDKAVKFLLVMTTGNDDNVAVTQIIASIELESLGSQLCLIFEQRLRKVREKIELESTC